MRVVAEGISNLNAEDCIKLEEPIPFEFAGNCRQHLIIAEDFEKFRPLLTSLHLASRNGDKPSVRNIIEALIATPFFINQDKNVSANISIRDIDGLKKYLIGENFKNLQLQVRPPVIPGMDRTELFNSRFLPLLPATSDFVLLDRFFGAQIIQDDFTRSGAYWFCRKVFELNLPRIKILTGKRVMSDNINLELLEDRIRGILSEVNSTSNLEVYLGFTSHDRQATFYFGKGRGSQSVTLGAGADIFRYENLREGFAIVNLDSETAVANENMVMNSSGTVKIEIPYASNG